MKPILIDCSLTGGRGSAKQAYELITELRSHAIPFFLLTDAAFQPKLTDMGMTPDFVVDTSLNDNPDQIIDAFWEVIEPISYSFMVKIGARMAGPTASLRRKLPYFILDGGLPDYMSDDPGLYSKDVFQSAEKYIITTQFDWEYPRRVDLTNVAVCCYPISQQTFHDIETLKNRTKPDILAEIAPDLDGDVSNASENLLIDIVMTGDYLTPPNRVAYGGWLTARQYDQSIGFIRRLFTDIGETYSSCAIFMDRELRDIVTDLRSVYPQIDILTYRDTWSFKTELYMKAAADLTICRATNYQPYIAALEKEANITTPVPADGYMDEDTAGEQYAEKGFTKLIPYDDEYYIAKMKAFLSSDHERDTIKAKLSASNFVRQKNVNAVILSYARSQISA
jgi:hypothetical protein